MCGGNTQQAPQTYTPTGQPGADATAQTGIQSLAGAGAGLQSQVDPALAQISQNVLNNPYFSQAMGGVQNAANMASSTVAPQMFQGAQQLQGLGAQAAGAANPIMQTAIGYGANAAPTAAGYGTATAPIAAGAGMAGSDLLNSYAGITSNPELMAGLQVLQTGFDPQQTLYNRNYQQMLDQQNAINSMNGVAGSPYAAGVTGQKAQDFNTDWQNQQLARQLQALGGYDSAASTAAGNLTNLVGTGSNVLNNGLTTGQNLLNNGLTTGQSLLDNGINTGVSAFSTLTGDANTSNMNAANLGTQGLDTLAKGAQLPYDLYLQQQQAGLAALGAQIQGTNAAGGLTQQATGDALNYLSTGQNATSVNQNATQQNNAVAQQQAAGFGNLFGTLGSMFLFA